MRRIIGTRPASTTKSRHALCGLRGLPLPLYVFVGDADPINRRLEGLKPLIESYRGAGLDVTLRGYPGGRHEMLNETNRVEVVADLLAWLEANA